MSQESAADLPTGTRQAISDDTVHSRSFEHLITYQSGRWRDLTDASLMIVDDEDTNIDVIEIFLEDAGYHNFIKTWDPTTAIDLLRRHRPDLLLLDINMPKVSGFDILKLIREDADLAQTRVIVLTASTDSQTKLQALQLGVSDFLSKPADPSELTLRVGNILKTKAYENRLAFYDALTGLPNRRMFKEKFQEALGLGSDHGFGCGLLIINLDRFKKINDTLNHEVGDALLQMVARRLENCLRGTASTGRQVPHGIASNLARIGGDEFAVMLNDLQSESDADIVARRIQSVLSESFRVGEQEVYVSASIGVSIHPEDGTDFHNLLKHADIALAHAKSQGRNNHQHYSTRIERPSSDGLNLETDLRRALDQEELVLHYQPKVDIASGTIMGCEALIRWMHPVRGMVSPMDFVPLAEELGLIVPFGEWVINTAFRQCAVWQQAGFKQLHVAVNVSSHQFRDGNLLQTIESALGTHGLAGESATVELTENAMLERAEHNIDVLRAIEKLGCRLAIDDFGTGYSSLSYLTHFPLNELKIDRSFISPIKPDSGEAPIVNAILAMAKSLNLETMAEGVEDAHQLQYLRDRGCTGYQGYHFSKPLTADDFSALLRKSIAA